MATLVYSPQIRVRIATRNNGVLDISDDLVAGSLNIRTNAVHTFSFQLQNATRKYDRVLRPMDRIVVEMKRITWVRVFSGYLNNGPIFSVWPRVLNITASCTLKRLQFWYWDSTAPQSQILLYSTMTDRGQNTTSPGVSADTANQGNGITGNDQAVRETAVKVLSEVVGWKQDKVHIAEVPSDWYRIALDLYNQVILKTKIPDELLGDFTSGGTVGGSSVGSGGLAANGTLQPGTYGGTAYDAEQANNASLIYNVAASRGLPAQAAVIALATAWQESGMRNLKYGDRDSQGLFQQRPSQGWGTVAQVTDPTYAAGKFYDALVKIPNWQTMSVTDAAQAVQRSAYPGAYAKWEGTARAAVDVLSKTGQQNSGGTLGQAAGGITSGLVGTAQAGANAATTAAGGPPPIGSGRNVALVAANLIQRNPPGHIRYQLGGDDAYTNPDPKVLDCSSFVDWVYYHAVGRPIQQGRTTAAFQQSWTAGQRISVETAKATKGALLFIGSPAHHVEVSLGNGKTAAAHTDGIPLEQQVNISPAGNGWTNAGLMPGVNYQDAATNQAAAAEISRVINAPTSVTDPNETGTGTDASGGGGGAAAAGPDGNAAFNAFVNVYAWGFQPTTSVAGWALTGPVALMNDEPMLPWIGNLMASIMRSWCSAPNGDFMAWFPDYFGLWDSAAKMNVKSIEVQDFTVEWYDQEIVTHQYVIGTPVAMFDSTTASVQATSESAQGGLYWAMTTDGIATVDFPEIFKSLFGMAATQQFIDEYLDRFGGRPNVSNIPTIRSHSGSEFFMALYLFMQRWANQFRANVPLTFMPELWPGMLLCLPEFQFQAYILEVNHSFQFGPNGGFKTDAKICAPARTSTKTDIFGLLPLAGSAR